MQLLQVNGYSKGCHKSKTSFHFVLGQVLGQVTASLVSNISVCFFLVIKQRRPIISGVARVTGARGQI